MSGAGSEPHALAHDQARRVYDRIGRLQDTQAFYEDPATKRLIEHGRFGSASRVLEFGCGTGRFAARLLSRHLPPEASYRGLDLSPRMVRLAQRRLVPFASRAEVLATDGSAPVAEPPGSRDRFVSTYVLDVLPEQDIADVLAAARTILIPGGLLCVTCLTKGIGPVSRCVAGAWARLHALRPALVGGCRPLRLSDWVHGTEWRVEYHDRLAPFGVPSEVLVAARR